jgi:hypothetical protein
MTSIAAAGAAAGWMVGLHLLHRKRSRWCCAPRRFDNLRFMNHLPRGRRSPREAGLTTFARARNAPGQIRGGAYRDRGSFFQAVLLASRTSVQWTGQAAGKLKLIRGYLRWAPKEKLPPGGESSPASRRYSHLLHPLSSRWAGLGQNCRHGIHNTGLRSQFIE